MIKLTIKGEPIAQARPRFTTRNGCTRAYNTNRVSSYKKLIQLEAKGKVDELLEKPLHVAITVLRSVPKSFSKKKRELALKREILPTQKPDLDNYIKIILDALNGVIWEDDKQVCILTVAKFFSDNPRIELQISEMNTWIIDGN